MTIVARATREKAIVFDITARGWFLLSDWPLI
jgi:hypothetical protein